MTHCPATTTRHRLRWSRRLLALAATIAAATIAAATTSLTTTSAAEADSPVTYTEVTGTLDSIEPGQPYRIRVPENWNGTLLSDMDYANSADSERNMYFLEQGYALSGIQRVYPHRRYNYDPAREIDDLLEVMDIFEAQFGNPDRILQVGFSGGGNVAVAMAEHHGDRIDGALAWGAHEPIAMMNQGLDQFYVLKTLLAPGRDDLWPQNPYELFPDDSAAMAAEWVEIIDAAQQTVNGRARIALAMTISQYPLWTLGDKPDAHDVYELEESMYRTARQTPVQGGGVSFGGAARFMFESACSGAMSWNVGVDYKEFFNNGNVLAKQAVRALYSDADAELRQDLAALNSGPRFAAEQDVLECWREAGRSVRGDLQVPLLRVHAIGDESVPVAQLQGYEDQVRQAGNRALYRSAFLDRTTHTRGSLAEQAAAVETLMQRLEKGGWADSTQPQKLNELGVSLFPDDNPLYIHYKSDPVAPVTRFNRTWDPEQG